MPHTSLTIEHSLRKGSDRLCAAHDQPRHHIGIVYYYYSMLLPRWSSRSIQSRRTAWRTTDGDKSCNIKQSSSVTVPKPANWVDGHAHAHMLITCHQHCLTVESSGDDKTIALAVNEKTQQPIAHVKPFAQLQILGTGMLLAQHKRLDAFNH